MGRPVEKENVSKQIHFPWPGLMSCNSDKIKNIFWDRVDTRRHEGN